MGLENCLIFVGLFMLWTLLVYIMHRLAHIKHRYNLLYLFHIEHHRIDYFRPENRKFKWGYLFFNFGGYKASLDVVLTLTIPAIIVYLLMPSIGIYILVFHYFYEVFLSEGILEHNPAVKGTLTKYFSWGEYHLTHHRKWDCNYSLVITVWDKVFGTQQSNGVGNG